MAAATRPPRLLLLAALLSILPLPAPADQAEQAFSWRPSLRFRTVVDDEVGLSGGGDGGVGFWLVPRVELDYRTRAVELGADLGVDARRYLDGPSSADTELYRAVGWAEVGLWNGLSLRLANAFVPQPLRVGLPEDDGVNLKQSNRADAELRYWRGLPGGRELEVGAGFTHFLSDEYAETLPLAGGGVAVDPDFRADYIQGLGFVELQNPLGEGSMAFVRTQLAYRDYLELGSASNTNLSLLLGVRSSRWSNLDLELSGGAGAVGFDAFAEELRALGRASLRYRFPRGFTLGLAAWHLQSPNLARQAAMESTGEISAEQRFGPATSASLRVFVTRFDGDLRGSAANLFGGAEVLLRRQLTRHLQVGFAYRHWRNRGGLSLDDFSQNRISLELGLTR
jgi:hypothetical protein